MGMFLILYYRINSMSILKFFSSKEKYNSIITFYSIMNLDEVLHYRRSVRAYDRTKLIDPERIKHCLELATLAPNSSDMHSARIADKGFKSLSRSESHFYSFTNSCFRGAAWLVQETCAVCAWFWTGEYPALQSERASDQPHQRPGIILWQIDAVCLCPFLWNLGIFQKTAG